MSGGFRLDITRAGWALITLYGVLWLLQLAVAVFAPESATSIRVTHMLGPRGYEVATSSTWPLSEVLTLHPPGSESSGTSPGFHPWQVLSAPLFYPPRAFPALVLAVLGFVFFAAPVERLLGLRGFLQLWLVASLGGVAGGLVLDGLIQAPVAPQFGFAPAVLAVAVVHCAMTPAAVVPFFFVLQVKMKWIAIAIATWVLALALNIEGGASAGGYALGGVVAGYLWWRSGWDLDPRRTLRRRRARKRMRVAVDRLVSDTSKDDGPIFH